MDQTESPGALSAKDLDVQTAKRVLIRSTVEKMKETMGQLGEIGDHLVTNQLIIKQYREFARAVLEEDSGLAVWFDPNYGLVRAIARLDEDARLGEDDDDHTPEAS